MIEVRLIISAVKAGAEPFVEPPDPDRSDSPDDDAALAFAY